MSYIESKKQKKYFSNSLSHTFVTPERTGFKIIFKKNTQIIEGPP